MDDQEPKKLSSEEEAQSILQQISDLKATIRALGKHLPVLFERLEKQRDWNRRGPNHEELLEIRRLELEIESLDGQHSPQMSRLSMQIHELEARVETENRRLIEIRELEARLQQDFQKMEQDTSLRIEKNLLQLQFYKSTLEREAEFYERQIEEIEGMCLTLDNGPCIRVNELRQELTARKAHYAEQIAQLEADKQELEQRLKLR
jgi:uncharacterized protein YlzI (FlbEa/FlbD family)